MRHVGFCPATSGFGAYNSYHTLLYPKEHEMLGMAWYLLLQVQLQCRRVVKQFNLYFGESNAIKTGQPCQACSVELLTPFGRLMSKAGHHTAPPIPRFQY